MFLQVSVCPHRGGVRGFIRRGVCVVLFWGVRGFIWGGMRGFIGGRAWFYSGGACVVFLEEWGMHGFSRGWGHVWFFQVFRVQWDTVNERAVHILLECILVGGLFLPPENEVWGKVICLQVCACPQAGAWSRREGIPSPGGGGIPGPGGCLVLGCVPGPRGAWFRMGCLVPGGCLVETPTDGYCYGRYVSYWNAFLFCVFSFPFFFTMPASLL